MKKRAVREGRLAVGQVAEPRLPRKVPANRQAPPLAPLGASRERPLWAEADTDLAVRRVPAPAGKAQIPTAGLEFIKSWYQGGGLREINKLTRGHVQS